MIGEAEAYKDYILLFRKADGKKNKAPRGPPPSLSPALQEALDEVHLVNTGYESGIPLSKMEYYSVRIRMIAAGIHALLNARMM